MSSSRCLILIILDLRPLEQLSKLNFSNCFQDGGRSVYNLGSSVLAVCLSFVSFSQSPTVPHEMDAKLRGRTFPLYFSRFRYSGFKN